MVVEGKIVSPPPEREVAEVDFLQDSAEVDVVEKLATRVFILQIGDIESVEAAG